MKPAFCAHCSSQLESMSGGKCPDCGSLINSLDDEACPDQTLLDSYLADSLPAAASRSIERHVQDCETCQAVMEQLIADVDFPMESTLACSVLIEKQRVTSSYDQPTPHPNRVDGDSFEFHRSNLGRYRIEKSLGQGGFGQVFLAFDEQLQRYVAVKLPQQDLCSDPKRLNLHLNEARTVATLDHPNIVPVYDVGTTENESPYIVSKYIDGMDLTHWAEASNPNLRATTKLVATVARALHYAHQQGIVHRDVKPSNILVDPMGVPYVVDFGLAVREQDVDATFRFAGTPKYMSPEQVRGEGHRVDGRSDIFSLGIVFYELLAKQHPFHAASRHGVFDQISFEEPTPLRHLERVPVELDRICMKSLAKPASQRYATALEFANDLQHFLDNHSVAKADAHSTDYEQATSRPQSVVPKGLRCFDGDDADFFFQLLPGPTDCHGVPESIRFWKVGIEQRDPTKTFAVGLIYGPSGCGKSSFVRAGLIPHLSDDVMPIYVESSEGETETRLLRSLRHRLPQLDDRLTLAQTLSALRRRKVSTHGRKVFIAIDQFEQCLHSTDEQSLAGFAAALRQCDGENVQCVLLVRDDFWMATTRFMKAIEVDIVIGKNSSSIDLFDVRHARNVMAAFGRAYSRLPVDPRNYLPEHESFLQQAVDGLAEDGRVVCVRLVLFAEMMKDKQWSPKTLRAAGGTHGIGVAFLDETFCSQSASPDYLQHADAARNVLESLLPVAGRDTKGDMRTYDELLTVSGYATDSKKFAHLLDILDNRLRLITRVESDDAVAETEIQHSTQRFYQLTHDYMVHAIREWIARRQQRTRRGRAELILKQRSEQWNVSRDKRNLPTLFEFINIRLFIKKRHLTDSQRQMMRAASGNQFLRNIIVIWICAVFLGTGMYLFRERTERGHEQVTRLFEVDLATIPDVVNKLSELHRLSDSRLKQTFAKSTQSSSEKLRAGVALMHVDSTKADFLHKRLRGAPSDVFQLIVKTLFDNNAIDVDRIWEAAFANIDAGLSTHQLSNVISELADEHQRIIDLAYEEINSPFKATTDEEKSIPQQKSRAALRKAVAAALLVKLGITDDVWRLLKHSEDPSLRSFLIHELSIQGVNPKQIVTAWNQERDRQIQSALLLSLGEFSETQLHEIDRAAFCSELLDIYRSDPDPGLHGAAEWLLRTWGCGDKVTNVDNDLRVNDGHLIASIDQRSWYVNSQRQTFVILSWNAKGDQLHTKEPYRFAISTKEITSRHFQQAIPETWYEKFKNEPLPNDETPMGWVMWNEAAQYCNWLSEQDGIPKSQWCYLPDRNGEYSFGTYEDPDDPENFTERMTVKKSHWTLSGYRMPLQCEWEFACRAKTAAEWFCGNTDRLLGKFAWYLPNSPNKLQPVGMLKPNGFGLFDIYGNVSEWCFDIHKIPPHKGSIVKDFEMRVTRGGSVNYPSEITNSLAKNRARLANPVAHNGLRPVRTLPSANGGSKK